MQFIKATETAAAAAAAAAAGAEATAAAAATAVVIGVVFVVVVVVVVFGVVEVIIVCALWMFVVSAGMCEMFHRASAMSGPSAVQLEVKLVLNPLSMFS